VTPPEERDDQRDERAAASGPGHEVPHRECGLVVIGASKGGVDAIERILRSLPATFEIPIVVCLHAHSDLGLAFIRAFDSCCQQCILEAEEKSTPLPGHIYVAPPDHHLLVERDGTFSISVDQKVRFARPSIDVLFESAAVAWGSELVGVLLTGANADGADGMRRIRECGGLTVVQSPDEADCPIMPQAAIATTEIEYVLPLDEICPFLATLEPPSEATADSGQR